MHCVMETHAFAGDAKRLDLDHDERHEIVNTISCDPMGGDLIPGTGGARKRRFKTKQNGKSGGYRVVWYYAAEDVPVYLLSIFDKGEKINLTKAERNELKKELSGIADDYRAESQSRIAELKRKAS